MERVGRSLRYGLSFEDEASSSQRPAIVKNSDNDVDFDDVFGGPPTRTRYSFGGGRIKSEESTSSSTGLGERPVFGESYNSPRRPTSDDFYDDIFRSSGESVRSPKWSSPTPGSRTLSPTQPYATSVPAEFSLPSKTTKAIDIPILGSGSSSPHRYKDGALNVQSLSTSLSRFSSPAMQGRDIFSNNPRQSPGQTLLSRESSGIKESLYSTFSTENEIDHASKHTTDRTGSPSKEFHFSIHKWANVGVPLLMSLRGGKHPTLKGSSKVSALSTDSTQDTGFPVNDISTDKEDTNPLSGSGFTEVNQKEIPVVKQEVINEQVIISPPPLSPLSNVIKVQGGEEVQGKEAIEKDVGPTGKKKKPEAKKINSTKKAEQNKPAIGSPKTSGENFAKSRVKGMVKDFFKMSNQEKSPTKTKMNAVGRSLSSRWKTTAKNKNEEEVADIISKLDIGAPAEDEQIRPDALKTAELDNKVPAENAKIVTDASKLIQMDSKGPADNVQTVTDASSTIPMDSKVPVDNVNMMPDDSVKGHIGKPSKHKFARNRTIKKLEDIYFQMDCSPASESVPYGSKANVENIDDSLLDNFQVEELSTEDKVSEEESEAIRDLDSKIHMWSNGRKGNIRSLLSTLQLVLWPESGWKAVALVDIIEANAVKKSYNRAMLCLHPDKLQQKGADSLKKYTAEKVFDILQEAWDHFNSLGTLL